ALHAYDYISENRRDFGITSFQPLAVGGDSAGGMLSAVVCQEIKRKGGKQPKAQLLIYPAVDFADTSGSMESCGEIYPLTSEIMSWFADQALASEVDLEDLRASPMREKDLSELAPAIVATAGFDPLRDQGEAYAKRLSDAGVETTYICYDTITHAFTAMSGVLPPAKVACEELAQKLGRMLR
ncbi:MAG: alpha/beta hydrolase, partial [Parvibaculaceae bacterium]|nr:alpha/beta hydrolase [Parvibaculaceae bacterium]